MSACFHTLGLLFVTVLVMLAGGAQAADCLLGAAGETRAIAVGETGRTTLIHLPRDFDPSRPAPMVFLLHGSGGTGEGILKSSKLADAADRYGFIVVAPDAGIPVDKGYAWNIPGVPTVTGKIPDAGDADDVVYLKATIDWFVVQGCADRGRVYATGLSGGGRMTSWLGCVASDRFAAIAPVVGLRAGNPSKTDPHTPDPATCMPSHALPVMAFAGDKDTTNPIQGGGAGYWQYTMHVAEQRWAQLNGCLAAPVTQWVTSGIYEERYSGCRDDADIVGRVTIGGGHSWVADNDAMWDFFARYSR